MGYQIHYGTVMVKTHVPEGKGIKISRKYTKIVIAGVVVLLAIFLCGREAVQDYLIPGNSQVTREAMSKLVSDLKDGELFSNSIEVFCREIVNGANISK